MPQAAAGSMALAGLGLVVSETVLPLSVSLSAQSCRAHAAESVADIVLLCLSTGCTTSGRAQTIRQPLGLSMSHADSTGNPVFFGEAMVVHRPILS